MAEFALQWLKGNCSADAYFGARWPLGEP